MADSNLLVIGIGNSLRSDDGVAAFIIGELQKRSDVQADFCVYQQLTTDLIPIMLSHRYVLLIDAAVGINTVQWQVVQDDYTGSTPSSHHIDPGQLILLASQLFHQKLSLTVCTLPVHDMEIGDRLSDATIAFAQQAIKEIVYWIQSNS